ncbi:uncharacterized protein LOC119740960 [Patiria miniata]|uniref:Uncharacterized protein n=1 Tax=Patiria miniata TaxID=46514 RepID=A0A914BAE1_PATMI|nr:uncharacterized protein LOC119740960 [Patiria miniata]
MDSVSETTGLNSTADHEEPVNYRPAFSLPRQATGEVRAFPLVNGLQASNSWPQNCSSPEFEAEVPIGGSSSVCFGPLGMENLSDQLLIQQGGLENDVETCGVPVSPSLYVSPPDLGEAGQRKYYPEPSIPSIPPTMEDSEAVAQAVDVHRRVAIMNPDPSQGIRKHRQIQGRLPYSRSGSPYSSDSMSSSSLYDRSTTPKDTYSFETNETSSSGAEVGSDKEKTSPWSRANFDRVLHDAPKREHIRSRKCGKGGDQSDSGSSSQSRSKPTKVPPMMRNKLHGRATADITVTYSGASSSSGSASMDHVHFHQEKEGSQGKTAKSCISNGTDTGIATSSASSQSVQSQSTCMSSSGVDTRQNGGKERKNLTAKSVSLHYHEIRISTVKRDELSQESSGPSHHHQHHFTHRQKAQQSYSSDSTSTDESERKRRRFNRTFVLLRHCGLLELTLQTASLMQQSTLMHQQLKSLRQQTEVLYNAIHGMSASQQLTSSFDSAAAQEIMKNLRAILIRQDGHSHSHNGPPMINLQHIRRMAVKRNSSGETISPDSCNAQSSSTIQNSGSST